LKEKTVKRKAYASLGAVCLCILVAMAVAGCSGTATTGGTSTTPPPNSSAGATGTGGTIITEQNFAFDPANVSVKVGDVVTFANKDSTPHNVTIDGTELGIQNQGESKTWTAAKDGTYPFSCIIHPSMTGQVVVGAGGSSAPAPTGGTGGGNAPPAGGIQLLASMVGNRNGVPYSDPVRHAMSRSGAYSIAECDPSQ
jgi:plastocyanin